MLASLLNPLVQAGVSVFAVSTYDTDYILIKEENLERASAALLRHGHAVQEASQLLRRRRIPPPWLLP